MKNIVLYIVSFIFIANTFIVSAAVKPCMHNDSNNPTQVEVLVNTEATCHSQQQEKVQQHCQDACFCMHFSVNQTPVIDAINITYSTTYQERLNYLDQLPHSRTSSPLYRPPIQHS